MAVIKNAQGLSGSQVLILQALIKAGVNGVDERVTEGSRCAGEQW